MKVFNQILLLTCASMLTACGGSTASNTPQAERIGSLPLTVEHPADNPTSAEKVSLGRMLF